MADIVLFPTEEARIHRGEIISYPFLDIEDSYQIIFKLDNEKFAPCEGFSVAPRHHFNYGNSLASSLQYLLTKEQLPCVLEFCSSS